MIDKFSWFCIGIAAGMVISILILIITEHQLCCDKFCPVLQRGA